MSLEQALRNALQGSGLAPSAEIRAKRMIVELAKPSKERGETPWLADENAYYTPGQTGFDLDSRILSQDVQQSLVDFLKKHGQQIEFIKGKLLYPQLQQDQFAWYSATSSSLSSAEHLATPMRLVIKNDLLKRVAQAIQSAEPALGY